MSASLVGSEMCIRDRCRPECNPWDPWGHFRDTLKIICGVALNVTVGTSWGPCAITVWTAWDCT
eukprot:5879335-Alexandrium_andersonii.AAC.1